jgi:beta-glucanase (GH16 family)
MFMKKMLMPTLLFSLLLAISVASAQTPGWTLVWADEFETAGAPDPEKWDYQLGDGCPQLCGWGNKELQFYTRDAANVRVEDGALVIQVHKTENGYTSARLTTKGKAAWKYGRIEASLHLPAGVGVWPAFWMLPADWKYGDWPAGGEIDIMEHVGYEPDTIHGTVHTQSYNHLKNTQQGGLIRKEGAAQKFHLYAIEWDADKIDFLVDDNLYFTFKNEKTGPDAWPFDQPFFILLNVTVGGNWGGRHGVDETIWPQQMLVDYVRVYQNEKIKN